MTNSTFRIVAAICLFLASDASVGRAAAGRREISPEEAHDLLTAFLKLPDGAVLKSGEMDYKGFLYFMAILTSGGEVGVMNVRYYTVDRHPGEVWNSVICQRTTSPPLRKLQMALRTSIGLTDTE
jgi:hypothetical protein